MDGLPTLFRALRLSTVSRIGAEAITLCDTRSTLLTRALRVVRSPLLIALNLGLGGFNRLVEIGCVVTLCPLVS